MGGLALLALAAALSVAPVPGTEAVARAAGLSAPLALAKPVDVAVRSGGEPQLPSTVAVTTEAGGTRDASVVWDLDGYTFTDNYQTMTVYGTVEDSLDVTAQVEVVPDGLEYFIDSSGTTGAFDSPAYDGVAALEGDALLNRVPDQARTADSTWGYDASQVGGNPSSTPGDKDSNGWYALGSGSSSKQIVYTLSDLPVGTHTLTAGFREWWTGPRQMKVTVTDAAGKATTVADDVTVGSKAPYTTTAVASHAFEVTTAGPVTMTVSIAGGSEAPVIGWLAVASGQIEVSPPVSVEAPTIDVKGGVYKTAQTVSLATTTEGAAIYYTTDGTTPSRTNGSLYAGPVTVSSSQTLQAIAFRNGTLSPVASAAYDIEPVPADGYSTVPVGSTWYDTDGNMIQGHGGNILQHDGWYYWVGENKKDDQTRFEGISLYKSKDLTNWTYVKDILTPDSSPELADANVERPKLLYNAKDDEFVLWAHWERSTDYSASHLMVAKSSTVAGDYTFLRDFRPGAGHVTTPDADPTYTGGDDLWGYGSRDVTVFTDPTSGDAYLVSTQDGENMRVYPLTDDYLDVDWQNSYLLFAGDRREAPALVKVGDYYVIITSSQSGWYPNQAMYSSTKDISDPDGWSDPQPIGNNTTFYSQPTNILPIQTGAGTTQYVYMGDRWKPAALGTSTYVWLPLQFSGTTGDSPTVSMSYEPSWSLDDASGELTLPQDTLVSEGKPVEASEAASGDHAAEAANDGNVFNLNTSGDNTNFYQPSSVPFSWTVDLQRGYPLSRIDLAFRSYNGSETYSGYTVQGSTDGDTWTTLVPASANRTVGFTSSALTGTYRYVRVNVSKVVNDHNGNEADWAAGLVEVQVYAQPDTTAPTVALSTSPTKPDGAAGWFVTSPVTVTASGTDDTAVASTELSVDGGDWVAGAAAGTAFVDVTGEGTHTVRARATDGAGNVSDVTSTVVKVDTAAPVSNATVDAKARTVALRAADDTSGVGRIQYRVGTSGSWLAYSKPVGVGSTASTVQYRAVDTAGNVEAFNAATVPAAGVVLKGTSTAAVVSSSSVTYGKAAKVTVKVTGSGGRPTGTVRVTDGTSLVGSGKLSSGKVTVTLSKNLKVGTHTLTVTYAGDKVFKASTDTVKLKVIKASSRTTVSVSPKSPQHTRRATVTAKVSTVAPSGSVVVKVSHTVKKTVVEHGKKTTTKTTRTVVSKRVALTAKGRATLTLPKLDKGTYKVTVAYGGSSTATSSKASTTMTVR